VNSILSRLRAIDWKTWRPRLGYAAFFALAFLLAFRQTFPVRALKERLILEASARGWQVDSAEVGPAGIVGMRATDVVLEDRAGTRIALDEVAVSLRLLPLLIGRQSVSFDLRLWDGRIQGTADVGSGARRVTAKVTGLDLVRAAPLRQAIRLELLGLLSGSVDVTIPAEPAGKATGRIDATVSEAGINGGALPIPGMSTPLTLPRVALGRIGARVVLASGKGTFEKLEARDGDAELQAEGLYFVPQPRLATSSLFGKLGVRISDAFLDRPGNAAFKGLLDLALRGARGKDGYYQLQLYGTLGSPQARPIAGGSAALLPPPPVPSSPGVPPAGGEIPPAPPPPTVRTDLPGPAMPGSTRRQRVPRPEPE
jgi:type II secretion system protein N